MSRIDFLSVFEIINSVEVVLKQDPTQIYDKMDYKTKDYYRSKIKEISKETKISEIYIANKALDLAKNSFNKGGLSDKKAHIGYYLISHGIEELRTELSRGGAEENRVRSKDR